jgi:hypothetical protein
VQYEASYSEFMSAQCWHMDACSHAPLDPGILVAVIYSELQVQSLQFFFTFSVRVPVVIGFCPRIHIKSMIRIL